MHHLNTGICFVKESCLSCLSALAEGAPLSFNPLYDQVMNFILSLFDQTRKSEYKVLRGSAIECSTIIAKAFPLEKFQPFQDRLIKIIINIMNNEMNIDGSDVQKGYILGAW